MSRSPSIRGSNCAAYAGHDVEVAVQDDRRRVLGVARADVDHHDGQAVVVEALDLELARLQPPLDEARGGAQAVERGRVVGDQPLGEDAFVHPAQGTDGAGAVPGGREVGWRHGRPHRACSAPPATPASSPRASSRGSASARCSRPADGARVRALADELGGLEWAVADVGAAARASRALVERGDVLIS